MLTRDDILAALHNVPDPEMPISIADLGLVHDVRLSAASHEARGGGSVSVEVDLLPTFIGCPALEMIADDVRAKVGRLPGVGEVNVKWIFDPPWSVDRITSEGRASLQSHGVTVPERGSDLPVAGHAVGRDDQSVVKLQTSAVPCPFCGSRATRLESPFGPTRCRMIYYCEACRNSFEHLKRVPVEHRSARERERERV